MTADGKKIEQRFLATLQYAKRPGSEHPIAAIIAKGLCLGLLSAGLTLSPAFAAEDVGQLSGQKPSSAHSSAPAVAGTQTQAVPASAPKRANFGREHASLEASRIADWIADSADNQGMPFMIVDKVDAKVFVFNADGRLRGAAPTLLGMALGDDSVAGIGERKLSTIRPEERTTPAGRFVASLDYNLHGQEMLWIDYETAVSLHRVVTTKPQERRAQRLDSATPEDNRISYGCINVPVKFYEKVVSPTFTGTNGIVYILPETRTAREVFGSYDVDERAQLQVAKEPLPTLTASLSTAVAN
ncbi:MAG: hypothetical protein ABIT34_05820 [Gammaproteobacteria bacterium]